MRVHILLMVIACTLRGADPIGWCPAKLQSLDYPALGLQARISGVVRLRIHIASDGSVSEMQIITGNKILGRAAQDNLRTWSFMHCTLPDDGAASRRDDIEVAYEFKLVGETQSVPKSQFSYEYPYRITVTSTAPHWTP